MNIIQRANSTTYSNGNVNLIGSSGDDACEVVPLVQAGHDVHEDNLVSALRVITKCKLMRIAHHTQALKSDTFNQVVALHIQSGNNT